MNAERPGPPIEVRRRDQLGPSTNGGRPGRCRAADWWQRTDAGHGLDARAHVVNGAPGSSVRGRDLASMDSVEEELPRSRTAHVVEAMEAPARGSWPEVRHARCRTLCARDRDCRAPFRLRTRC